MSNDDNNAKQTPAVNVESVVSAAANTTPQSLIGGLAGMHSTIVTAISAPYRDMLCWYVNDPANSRAVECYIAAPRKKFSLRSEPRIEVRRFVKPTATSLPSPLNNNATDAETILVSAEMGFNPVVGSTVVPLEMETRNLTMFDKKAPSEWKRRVDQQQQQQQQQQITCIASYFGDLATIVLKAYIRGLDVVRIRVGSVRTFISENNYSATIKRLVQNVGGLYGTAYLITTLKGLFVNNVWSAPSSLSMISNLVNWTNMGVYGMSLGVVGTAYYGIHALLQQSFLRLQIYGYCKIVFSADLDFRKHTDQPTSVVALAQRNRAFIPKMELNIPIPWFSSSAAEMLPINEDLPSVLSKYNGHLAARMASVVGESIKAICNDDLSNDVVRQILEQRHLKLEYNAAENRYLIVESRKRPLGNDGAVVNNNNNNPAPPAAAPAAAPTASPAKRSRK
jgi:hypothetical protein